MGSRLKIAVFCALAASLITGCWRGADTPVPPPAVEYDVGPDLSFESGENSVHISPGNTTSKSQIEFPVDVMLSSPPPTILGVSSPSGQYVEYTTTESPTFVRQMYVEELARAGWELSSETTSNSAYALSAAKATRSLYILVDPIEGEGGTLVTQSHVVKAN